MEVQSLKIGHECAFDLHTKRIGPIKPVFLVKSN